MINRIAAVQVRSTDTSLVEGVKRYLSRLQGEQFYGVVEIQYQAGEIVLVRKQESFKPSVFLVVE